MTELFGKMSTVEKKYETTSSLRAEVLIVSFLRMESIEQTLSSHRKCHSCHDQDRDTILLPCSHFIICRRCANENGGVKICPKCHSPVSAVLQCNL